MKWKPVVKTNLVDPDTHVENKQCFGSGLDPDSIRSIDPDPDLVGQKCRTKLGKN